MSTVVKSETDLEWLFDSENVLDVLANVSCYSKNFCLSQSRRRSHNRILSNRLCSGSGLAYFNAALNFGSFILNDSTNVFRL